MGGKKDNWKRGGGGVNRRHGALHRALLEATMFVSVVRKEEQ